MKLSNRILFKRRNSRWRSKFLEYIFGRTVIQYNNVPIYSYAVGNTETSRYHVILNFTCRYICLNSYFESYRSTLFLNISSLLLALRISILMLNIFFCSATFLLRRYGAILFVIRTLKVTRVEKIKSNRVFLYFVKLEGSFTKSGIEYYIVLCVTGSTTDVKIIFVPQFRRTKL